MNELDSYQKNLVQFLKKKFCSPHKINGEEVSRNEYADKSEISRGTFTRLKKGEGYDVPTSTIFKLCKFEDIKVVDFYMEFDAYLEEKDAEAKK
ncbi:helix-turn-helix domain-containing protein [Sphingobacterium pedocola]|uniref:HTH cro/C1-type domain-containing protein n=1 Tax=Sphingobacterium pedocola TaxID=2082722 RepID=A0ABR9T3T3_9SPHI|nr:helix-turn-helix transcriptional regulator [Sphingobacterium pedocola]MBE8719950.1 hypothetical protein [Sphingobacterium pedocola]